MVKLFMLAILDRILHLASQTMHFRVSYFVRYFNKTPKMCCLGLIARYFPPKNVWYNLNQ